MKTSVREHLPASLNQGFTTLRHCVIMRLLSLRKGVDYAKNDDKGLYITAGG